MKILAYTTFGCYSSDDENMFALKQIIKALRPGGYLLIEQFNPNLEKSENPYWIETQAIDERLIRLIKTTQHIQAGSHCMLYAGEYVYSENTMRGPRVIRRDDYCIRLYKESWFKNILMSEDYGMEYVKCYANFTDKLFAGKEDEKLMIVLAKKPDEAQPVVSQQDAKSIVEKIREEIKQARQCSQSVELKAKKYKINCDRDFRADNSILIQNIMLAPPDDTILNLKDDAGSLTDESIDEFFSIIRYYLDEK